MSILNRLTTVSVLFVLGLGVAAHSIHAQIQPNELAFIDDSADAAFLVRIAKLMNSEQVKRFRSEGGETAEHFIKQIGDTYFGMAGVDSPSDISLFTGATSMPNGETKTLYSVQVLRTVKDNQLGFDMVMQMAEKVDQENIEYFKFKKPKNGMRFANDPNGKSIIWAQNEASIKKSLEAGNENPTRAKWFKHWQKKSKHHASMVLDENAIRPIAQFVPNMQGLKNAKLLTGGASLGKTLKIEATVTCNLPNDAEELLENLESTIEKLETNLVSMREDNRYKSYRKAIDMGSDILKAVKMEQKKNTVELRAETKINLLDLLPMLEKARDASVYATAKNRVRQVALSMHNFESAYQKFPNSVMVSEQGKKYSWRIAILPFIGEKKLYDRYRFDEDWDSPHNTEVTSEMPEYFRHPNADKDSTNSSWFFVVGEGTMFDTPETSLGFAGISDGTSNTIMAVEAKRNIHWAKPEDISFNPERFRLGGYSDEGFIATLADGSVHHFSNDVEPEVLQKFFTAADGQVVNMDEIRFKPKEDK